MVNMGTLILPPIHFNDQVYDSMVGLGEKQDVQRRQSSSGGSSRSPLDLPMSVTAGQTQRTMTASRALRQRRHQAVGQAARASGAQCEQNKQLFESALQRTDGESLISLSSSSPEPYFNYTNSQQVYARSPKDLNSTGFSFTTSQQSSLPSLTDTLSSSPSHSDRPPPTAYVRSATCSIRSRHNGPSAVGSPLYNKHRGPTMAPAASSAPSGSGRYNHERYWTRSPAAQTYMDRVSSAFRVVTTPRPYQHPDDATSGSASKDRSGFLSLPQNAEYADILLMPSDSELCPEEYFKDHPAVQPRAVTVTNDLPADRDQLPHDPHLSQPPHSPGPITQEGQYHGETEKDTQGIIVDEKGEPDVQEFKEDLDEKLSRIKTREESENSALKERPEVTHKEESKARGPRTSSIKKEVDNVKSPSKTKLGRDDKRDATSKPTSAAKDRAAADGDAGSVSGSSSSGLPSRPSSAQYWRTKTWVDDATVTSTPQGSQHGDDAGGEVTPNDPQQTPTKCKSPDVKPEVSFKPEVKSKTDGKGKSGGKNADKTKPETGKSAATRKSAEATKQAAKAVEEEVKAVTPVSAEVEAVKLAEVPIEVMNLNDLKRKRRKLPDFICPSSEDKSRESAVLDWLETTSIHWAMKTSPLL